MNRRKFLTSSALTAFGGAASGLWLPGRARAATLSGSERNFVFVFNHGGWDPTRVLAPTFDLAGVEMEMNAEPWSVGGLSLVDQRDRPSTRAFFEAWHERCLILNGILVSSIAHNVCIQRVLTGSGTEGSSDWPAIIAADMAADFTLPHLVLGGPSFPGPLGEVVARAGQEGQLADLLTGDILDRSDYPVVGPTSPSEGIVDRYLARRTAARAEAASNPTDLRLSASIDASFQRAMALKDFRYVMDLTGGDELELQIPLAVEALNLGMARCITLGHPGDFSSAGWDTHGDNDEGQSELWESLFNNLNQLMRMLDSTPGRYSPTLADETVVVVLSEMGRSPYMNSSSGKDHWPYTSAMIVGPGITGDRMVGGWRDGFKPEPIDFASGEQDSGGAIITAESVGATLLALADIDPGDYVPGHAPIEGVLL